MLHLAVGPRGRLEPHMEPTHLNGSPPPGQVFGDRGNVVDAGGEPTRQFETARWVYAPTSGTGSPLHILDEATALAAGHRPCEVNDPARFAAFAHAVGAAGSFTPPPPDWIDAQLHAERLDPAGTKPLHTCRWGDVPTGAFVEHDWGAWLVLGDSLHQWSATSYAKRTLRPRHGTAQVLTPPLTLGALTAGYVPAIHPSAGATSPTGTFATAAVPAGPGGARPDPVPPDLTAARSAGEIRVRFHTTGTPWWRDEDHAMLGVSYETISAALFGDLGMQRFLRWGGSFAQMTSLMPRPVHSVAWQEGGLADVVIGGMLGGREVAALVPAEVAIPTLRVLDMAPGRARDMIPEMFRAHPKLDLVPEAFDGGAPMRIVEEPVPCGPQAGWYPDPVAERDLRWWDGTTWTAHVREDPSRTPSGRTA
ncbi:MAG: DUF2510 domain-containing protein [Acidimicrobiia bacterium]|nr:DUF2510 domain-containing protein [Acidimicrobiia bacterium]